MQQAHHQLLQNIGVPSFAARLDRRRAGEMKPTYLPLTVPDLDRGTPALKEMPRHGQLAFACVTAAVLLKNTRAVALGLPAN
jgi:hypothetical protein